MAHYANVTLMNNDKWVFRKRKVAEEEVKLRLFLFPPAGSDISIYHKWEEYLPPSVEICLIRLPGRGGRINDPLIDDCKVLVHEIADNIEQYFDMPYVFFGHSMGSLIAYETTVLIYERGRPLPEKLFVSSLKAPNYMNSKNDCFSGIMEPDEDDLHLLSNEELKNKLYHMGGIPDIIRNNSSFVEMLLPIFRNDLKLCETYKTDKVTRLPVPIDVYGGNSDRIASKEDLEKWKECSKEKVTITLFPGGHFYFNNMNRFFMFDLSKKLEEVICSDSDNY
jgi:medium-chain acyl-[acyl-carrier-protein] hydrolase